MTETPTNESAASDAPAKFPRRTGGALGGKVLAELQEIAAGLGIAGATKMRKGELIDAIKAARGESSPVAPQAALPVDDAPQAGEEPAPRSGRRRGRQGAAQDDAAQAPREDAPQDPQDQGQQDSGQDRQQGRGRQDKGQGRGKDQGQPDQGQDRQQDKGQDRQQGRGQQDRDRADKPDKGDKGPDKNGDKGQQGRHQQPKGQQGPQGQDGDGDDDDQGGRRRNRRGRNRGTRGPDGEPTYSEDDVLVPAAGILDILDNYAFVRTTGYLPSESDVYVSLSMVRKWGLRKGDAVTGQVRQPREGERREKFNPMVRVDTVNGMPLEEARGRVDFDRLTPVFPDERLRLETEPTNLTTRVIDLVAPLGKGQRGLVVSPPQAGRTSVVQAVANAVTVNNPECHLMVVLVDERPEEVTQVQRSVKGEVIASTFDRPASDHTTVAELAIERAKRLVELGHDVVVLLDSLTRLGRAYVQEAGSGRAPAGSVDVAALYPPKRFFGAARNVEDGGSLTIVATALVETGSAVDEVVLEEFRGAATSELRLSRELADKRRFPAIDVSASSTRREEALLDAEELAILWRLRRVLADLDVEQAQAAVLERVTGSATNAELLMTASRTLPADS